MNFKVFEKNDLFEKYNIKAENIEVTGEISDCDSKDALIYYLLQGFEYARNNELKGNITSSSFACGLVLDDNSVYFGVNFNNTRNEISGICAERLAILDAFNSKVKLFNQNIKKPFDFKIKYILMASYKEENAFWMDKITPCADCLSWFNTGKFLEKDTKICSLKKDQGKIYLDIQKLENFLPLRNLSYGIIENICSNTKITKSINAKNCKLSDDKIIELYKTCLNLYKNNNLAGTSNQNIVSCVLSGGEIFSGVKIDYSKRWFTEPLEMASVKAIEKFGQNTVIDAICYVGDEYTTTETNEKVKDGLISIQTIGRLSTRFINNDTPIITSSNSSIDIRTVKDYLPSEHKFIHSYKIN